MNNYRRTLSPLFIFSDKSPVTPCPISMTEFIYFLEVDNRRLRYTDPYFQKSLKNETFC